MSDEGKSRFLPCTKDIFAVMGSKDGEYTLPVIAFEVQEKEFGEESILIPQPLVLATDGQVIVPEDEGNFKHFDGDGFMKNR